MQERSEPENTRRLVERLRRLEQERDAALAQARQARADQYLLRTVVEGTSHAVFVKDLKSRYILFNPAAEQVTGRGADDVLGRDDAALFPPAEAQRIMQHDQEVIACGRNITFEEPLPDAAGHLHTFLTTKGPMRDEGGQVTGVFGIARDITALKRAEEARRQSEQRYQLVNRATNDVIWDLDLTQNRICWTGAVQAALGYTEEEISPALEAWAEHLHPDDRDRVVSGLQGAIQGPAERWSEEYRFRRKDGTYAVLFDRGFIVRDEGGRAIRMIGSIQDITLRKRLEAERDRLMYELEAIIQFLPEGLVLYGTGGEILRINPAADALLSYSPEFRRKSFAERNAGRWKKEPAGEPLPLERLPVMRALRGEIVQMEPLTYETPDDRSLWLNVSAAPIYSSAGRLQGTVAVYSDIRRLRQLQEEKEGFLHTVTHDLRTPLTVIQGHADMLQPVVEKAGLGEIPSVNLEAIQNACRQMTRMMEDLSEMARLEGGKLKLQPEAIDLRRFVTDYLRRNQVAIDLSRLNVDIPPDLPPAWADPPSLERCLGNLVSNAFKYSDEQSPIQIRAKAEGEELILSVKDEGAGVAPEDLPHLFERFFRARRAKKQGLGLGLFITRSLVEAQNGRIWVESEPGQGSTFGFSLPRAKTVAREAESRPEMTAAAESIPTAPTHCRGHDARLASNEVWKRLVDSDLVGVVIADFEGNLRAANDYYLDLLGYTREELQAGRVNWRNVTPPEHRKSDERALAELRAHGFCTPYEKEYARKDGSRVSVLLANALLPGGQIAAFVLNTTECKRLERQLRESDLRFQALVDNATPAIFLKDREGKLTLVNRSFEQLYHLPAEALIGKRFEDFCPDPGLAAAVQAHDRAVLESGVAVSAEEIILLPDGPHVFLTSKFPLRNARGDIYGLGAIATEKTEAKEVRH